MNFPRTRRNFSSTSLAFLLILLLGASVRFFGIQDRGPAFFDEGIYTLEGRWIYTASASLWSAFLRKIEETRSRKNLYTFEDEARRFRENVQGQPPSWGRPGYSLLTGLCMGVIGPKLYAAHAVSALFGTLAILAVFLLARTMFDERTALLAALLLALSGYHMVYSTSGLADGAAMCVALFAFYFYYRSRRGDPARPGLAELFLAGLLCGFAFTVHDRFLYALLVMFACEGLDMLTGNRLRSLTAKRGLLLGSVFLVPLVLFEIPYYLGMVFLRHFEQALPFRTYFEELATHHIFNLLDAFAFPLVDLSGFPEIQEAGSHLWNFLTYPYLFFRFDGPVLCLLFLAGLVLALRNRSPADRLLLVWFFLPFVLFSVGLVTSSRYALVFLPSVMVLSARSVVPLLEVLRRLPGLQRIPAAALWIPFVTLMAVSGWLSSDEIRAMRCNYDAPADFLRAHGSRHVSLQYPVSRAYFGMENVMEPPDTKEKLREFYEQGYRYLLIDYRRFFLRPPFDVTERGRIIAEIERNFEPVFSHVHPCYAAPCYLFEINFFFRMTTKILRDAHALGLDRICIYDLAEVFEGSTN